MDLLRPMKQNGGKQYVGRFPTQKKASDEIKRYANTIQR